MKNKWPNSLATITLVAVIAYAMMGFDKLGYFIIGELSMITAIEYRASCMPIIPRILNTFVFIVAATYSFTGAIWH